MSRPAHGWIDGANGLRIFYRLWEAEQPRGRVLCVHGLGEHGGRYDGVAAAVTGAGYDCCAFDLRGHGRSEGRRGHVRAFEDLLRDLDRVRRQTCREGTEGPTFLLGHSLGGLIVGRWLQEFGAADCVEGAVFLAPLVEIAKDVPGWKRTIGDLADRFVPALTLDNGIGTEELFRTEAEREEWDADPGVHHRISARLWGEMQRAAGRLREGSVALGVPSLFLLPGDDRVVSTAAAEAFAARVDPPAEIRVYEGAFHALHHDPATERCLADLTQWLDRHTREPGSGV